MRWLIVGTGLSGAAVGRTLAEAGERVRIIDRRDVPGGNMKDHLDPSGIMVQDYGPHTFHTNDRRLMEYMERFQDWDRYELTCGAVWDGSYTPTPFNFTTIDTFFGGEKGEMIKEAFRKGHPGKATITVTEALSDPDPLIREYAQYLFEKDYRPYSSKQWGRDPSEIDPSVLRRVPLRLSYRDGYFDDEFQVMPATSFTDFFDRILDHPNITLDLGVDSKEVLSVRDGALDCDEDRAVYTGALDELFGYSLGRLPYRSLTFEWVHHDMESFQPAPVVAYPSDPEIVRITEYNKLPVQKGDGTVCAVERSHTYEPGSSLEPYYPVLTDGSIALHDRYRRMAEDVEGLSFCGRLADFRYYNMDQALDRALSLGSSLVASL